METFQKLHGLCWIGIISSNFLCFCYLEFVVGFVCTDFIVGWDSCCSRER